MSRRGNCWDNAPAESFFGTLKKELIQGETYRTRQQAVSAIFEYIEVFYNRQRRHSKLGYQSPVEFEDKNQKPSLSNSPLNGGNSRSQNDDGVLEQRHADQSDACGRWRNQNHDQQRGLQYGQRDRDNRCQRSNDLLSIRPQPPAHGHAQHAHSSRWHKGRRGIEANLRGASHNRR